MSSPADPQPRPQTRQRPGGACEECRGRKLRCDRQQPQCGLCAAAGVVCHVTTNRAPRGPKRGYLKAMQARIAALEGAVLQQHNDGEKVNSTANEDWVEGLFLAEQDQLAVSWDFPVADAEDWLPDPGMRSKIGSTPLPSSGSSVFTGPESITASASSPQAFDGFGDDLASLDTGRITAALDGPDDLCATNMSNLMQAELDQLYFDRVHAFAPVVHHGRYSSWARQPAKTKAQQCLQYTLWTSAGSTSAHYHHVGESLYRKARRLLEESDEKPTSPPATEIELIQAWLLLAIHELVFVDFRRGWISAGRAFRLIQLDWSRYMDASDMAVEPPQWVEAEQRRRTFWMAYCLDRFNVIRLPAAESEFQSEQPVMTGYLAEAIASRGASATSPFVECIVVATMSGRALSHQQLANTQPNTSQEFWDRHQWNDAMLRQRMGLFSLKYPPTVQEADPMLIFIGMMWRTTLLFLSQIPGRQVSPSDETSSTLAEHARRCSLAAQDVVCLTTKLSRLNWFKVHPLTPIPLSLCGELLAAHGGLDESLGEQLSIIQELLCGLRSFNKLGQGIHNYL
ncbi:hypothetical protein DL764_005631 [Monosporascus ibericus]|uniref:Zn(2)-C6 fungal-type domain-containing protein n=1 Tax=Monosporascus ibericus TaxID=155417 RepID=A0A4Q4TBS9_9PEZI|nr:hypothetical protein DL764_005631 [Monosporascus ibericus]